MVNLRGKMAPAMPGPVFVIFVLLVVILGFELTTFITSTTMQADVKNTLSANEPCFTCAQANMDLRTVTYDVVTGVQSGWYFNGGGPVEASVAVGNDVDGGRVVTSLDYMLQILNKQTNEVLTSVYVPDWLFGSFGEAWVQYDERANRFFYVVPAATDCYQGVIVEPFSVDEGIKCSGLASFGSQNYDVEGIVVVADPADGCAPLNNAGDVNTNIALVQLSSNCDPTVAAKNVQNAGGIATLFYDDAYEFVFDLSGTDGTIFIPSQLIGLADGLQLAALAATTDVVVTMNSSAPTGFLFGIYVLTSMSSAPSSAADFSVQLYTNANWTDTVFVFETKSEALPGALLVTAAAFIPDDFYAGDTMVLAFNKPTLLAGGGPLLLWTETPLGTGSNDNFMHPAHNQGVLNNGLPVVFFLSVGEGVAKSTCPSQTTTLVVRWANEFGLVNGDTPYLLTMPPLCFNQNQGTRQPEPLIPLGFAYSAAITSAVVSNLALGFAVPNTVSSVHTTMRWGQIDLSTFASDQQLRFSNVGDVNPTPTLDFTSGCMQLDADGNALLLFTSNGPNHFMSATYTGRLRSDPPNTMRYPLQNWAQGIYTFFNSQRHGAGWRHQGCAINPSNHKDVYMFAPYPDPNGPIDDDGRAISWTAALGTTQINAVGFCPPGSPNHPQLTPVNAKFEAQYALDNPWNRSASIEDIAGSGWPCMNNCPAAIPQVTRA